MNRDIKFQIIDWYSDNYDKRESFSTDNNYSSEEDSYESSDYDSEEEQPKKVL